MTNSFFFEKFLNLKNRVSKKYETLVHFISHHPKEIAFMTLADLSKATGISKSTIVRFAVSLGYRGYPAFRKDFQQVIRSELTTFERFKLFSDRRNNFKRKSHPCEKTFRTEKENLQRLLDSLSRKDIEPIIQDLLDADTVFIAGGQSTESIAQYFAYHLSIISNNIRLIQRPDGDAINILKTLNQKSLVFLIGLVRYPRALVQIGKWAKLKGAKVVVITDKILCPYKEVGDVFLIVPTTFISFLYTNAALITLLNAIIVEFGSRRKGKVLEHLKRWEETHKFQSIFV